MSSPLPASPDIQAKYQKLATEYAKLRAQIGVLKKGVLDEQNKSADLTETLKDKETQLRKQESEMESVLFRNQQLAKRVNVLQDEIESVKSKPHKSLWRSSNAEQREPGNTLDRQIVNEELVAKITENARLHATIEDIEDKHSQVVADLQQKIKTLEQEQVQKRNESREVELENTVADLTNEREHLSRKIADLDRDLGLKNEKMTSAVRQLDLANEKLGKLESSVNAASVCDVETQYSFVDEVAEENQRELVKEKEHLAQRLADSIAKCKELEQAKEHWKLEFQLIQMKIEKMKEEGRNSNPSQSPEVEEVWAMRESELKSMFEDKLTELVSGRLLSDSKAVAYYLECEALQQRIVHLQNQSNDLSILLEGNRSDCQKLKEEAATTAVSYESQLSAMSDHLAEMNSKVAEQTDVIQQLKFELGNQGKKDKKGKK